MWQLHWPKSRTNSVLEAKEGEEISFGDYTAKLTTRWHATGTLANRRR